LNTATIGQTEHPVDLLGGIKIYYDAVLASPANITVKVGDQLVQATWDEARSPAGGGPGVYHGSYAVPGLPVGAGPATVVVSLSRDDTNIVQIQGMSIGGCSETGMENFNAWVGTENVVKIADSLASSTLSACRSGAVCLIALCITALQLL
jgi:hypothetical protein